MYSMEQDRCKKNYISYKRVDGQKLMNNVGLAGD